MGSNPTADNYYATLKMRIGKLVTTRPVSIEAAIAQLGERQTEDLEVPSSILGHGIFISLNAN